MLMSPPCLILTLTNSKPLFGKKCIQVQPSGLIICQKGEKILCRISQADPSEPEACGNKPKHPRVLGSGETWNQLKKWTQVNPSEPKWTQVHPSEPKWTQMHLSGHPPLTVHNHAQVITYIVCNDWTCICNFLCQLISTFILKTFLKLLTRTMSTLIYMATHPWWCTHHVESTIAPTLTRTFSVVVGLQLVTSYSKY